MSRIQVAFAHQKAFIPFITCGDPNLECTKRFVLAMAEAGADLIELGIPFSDPTAEGPVIMEASERALAAGATVDPIFAMVQDLRTSLTLPLVFMTYANVVYSYGIDRFAERCAAVGIDGLILPDVPYEEKEEFDGPFAERGIDLISMIAPTSEDRIRRIAGDARGFLYIVSSLGVTGVRSSITTDIAAMVKLVRASTSIPCVVGFGISTPEQASAMAAQSDGAIVGSAVMRLIAAEAEQAEASVRAYVKQLADAVHQTAE